MFLGCDNFINQNEPIKQKLNRNRDQSRLDYERVVEIEPKINDARNGSSLVTFCTFRQLLINGSLSRGYFALGQVFVAVTIAERWPMYEVKTSVNIWTVPEPKNWPLYGGGKRCREMAFTGGSNAYFTSRIDFVN